MQITCEHKLACSLLAASELDHIRFLNVENFTLSLLEMRLQNKTAWLKNGESSFPVEGYVSLLKSKSGFLIWKRIFRFFTKIQKRIIETNDPQRRWILWVISKTGYFDTCSEAFLYYGSEKSEYCQR